MKILLIGSTGSIGTSTCNRVREHCDEFEIVGLAANRNSGKMIDQIREFSVKNIFIADKSAREEVLSIVNGNVRHFDTIEELVSDLDYDILLNAIVGYAGFTSTVAALKRGKKVALANKESLVVGGDYIATILKKYGGTLIPVDSEHSAIQQCLTGEDKGSIEKITVTASGGPFRELPIEKFDTITVEDALNHPTWAMGNKITIDSSTLMNKGFEVIEAHYLFNIPYEQIDVLVHPQSIIHSMVTFTDGAVMAQCGVPDMELPIQYALTYPKRATIKSERLDFAAIGRMTFERPDYNRFPCLKLCIDAGKIGGTALAVLNGANEVAVSAFLNGKLSYTGIPKLIEKVLEIHENSAINSVEAVKYADTFARKKAVKFLEEVKF